MPNSTAELDVSYRWESDNLDLDAYLKRVNYQGPLDPTPQTLRKLQRAHTLAIPFESIEVKLGHQPRLDIIGLQNKMVYTRRGGYCYEQNILFATVLDRLGFQVTGLNARMLVGRDAYVMTAAGHTVLRVDLEGHSYIVDVGGGSAAAKEVLELVPGSQCVDEGGWRHRLELLTDGNWLLQQYTADGWFNVYKFSLEQYFRSDYESNNFFAANAAKSPFTRMLVVIRRTLETEYSLIGLEFSETRAASEPEKREIAREELPGLLEEVFGLELSPREQAELVAVAAPASREQLYRESQES